jgi:hypothetical protein
MNDNADSNARLAESLLMSCVVRLPGDGQAGLPMDKLLGAYSAMTATIIY